MKLLFNCCTNCALAWFVQSDKRIGGSWAVEVDATLVGAKTRGEGRGVHHKTYVVGAVEAREKADKRGRGNVFAGRLRLLAMDDRSGKSLDTFVTENVLPSSQITTDGWVGYNNLAALGYNHASVVLDGDMKKAEQALPMIHFGFLQSKSMVTWSPSRCEPAALAGVSQ